MASRKEEKERLRQAREAAEAADARAQRKRLLFGYVVAGLITAAVAVGIVVAIVGGGDGDGGGSGDGERVNEDFGVVPESASVDDREAVEPAAVEERDLEAAAEAANCELRTDLPDEGNAHIPGDQPPEYRTSPPTSGDHSPNPLADGAFTGTLSPLNYLHSLEHGRIEIQYSPELPEEDQLTLLGVYDADPPGLIVFPNEEMPFEVAVTAWRQLLGCESYEGQATLDAVRAFIAEYRGRGPEAVPLS